MYSVTCLRSVRWQKGERRRLRSARRAGVSVSQELLSEGGFGAKNVGVNEGHEAVELHEGVLEGRGRKEKLLRGGKGGAEGLGVLVVLLVDVAEAMGFIEDDEIPGDSI